MVIAILFIALVSAAYVLGWSSLFTVKHVVVVGAPNPAEAFAIEQSIPIGEKMARLESQGVGKSLKGYTWLDHSSVRKDWLKGIVTIHVWTRTPIAQFQSHLMDASGAVFDLPSVDVLGLPTITAPNEVSAQVAVKILAALPESMRSHVRNIAIHGSDSAVLTLLETSLKRVLTVVWGDEKNMALKVQVYQALLALPENSKIHLIDLSAPHAPIVK